MAKGNLEHDNSRNEPLTDDELHALTLHHKKQYESALAKKKEAAAAFLSVTKKIKAELGESGILDIKDMIAADGDEDFEEKFQAELERKARLARWRGLSVGSQAELFDFAAVKPGVAERAFEDGKRAGLAGEVCKPPFDGGGEGHNEYVRGWHSGQSILASQIKKTEAKEVPLMSSSDPDSGVDELDEVASEDSGDEGFGGFVGGEQAEADREPAEAL